MTTDKSGPAFPTQHVSNGNTYDGMSLRDWFAGQALAGFMGLLGTRGQLVEGGEMAPQIVKGCYGLADAMLKERSK